MIQTAASVARRLEAALGRLTRTESVTVTGSLSRHELAAAIKNDRRSAVIRDLDDHDGSIRLRYLADRRTRDEAGPGYATNDRKRVYVSLYQSHLPKLDDWGIVKFDSDRGTISRGPNYQQARAALQQLDALTGGVA